MTTIQIRAYMQRYTHEYDYVNLSCIHTLANFVHKNWRDSSLQYFPLVANIPIGTCVSVERSFLCSYGYEVSLQFVVCRWEEFTDAIIRALNQRDRGVVFLLWGKPAHTKQVHGYLQNPTIYILGNRITAHFPLAIGINRPMAPDPKFIYLLAYLHIHLFYMIMLRCAPCDRCLSINTTKHVVIKSSHPSPLGATKTNEPFIGSRYMTPYTVGTALVYTGHVCGCVFRLSCSFLQETGRGPTIALHRVAIRPVPRTVFSPVLMSPDTTQVLLQVQ